MIRSHFSTQTFETLKKSIDHFIRNPPQSLSEGVPSFGAQCTVSIENKRMDEPRMHFIDDTTDSSSLEYFDVQVNGEKPGLKVALNMQFTQAWNDDSTAKNGMKPWEGNDYEIDSEFPVNDQFGEPEPCVAEVVRFLFTFVTELISYFRSIILRLIHLLRMLMRILSAHASPPSIRSLECFR